MFKPMLILISHEKVSDIVQSLLIPEEKRFVYWMNYLTARVMEKALRKTKTIPFYYGFSEYSYDQESCIFKPWPFYYKKSSKIRKRQIRQRLGRWIREVIIPKLMK